MLSISAVVPMSFSLNSLSVQGHCLAQITQTDIINLPGCSPIFQSVQIGAGLLTPPVGRFQFQSPTDDIVNGLKIAGLIEVPGARNVFEGSVSDADMRILIRARPQTTKFTPGRVDFDAYLAYMIATKGMQIFAALTRALSVGQFTIHMKGKWETDALKKIDHNTGLSQDSRTMSVAPAPNHGIVHCISGTEIFNPFHRDGNFIFNGNGSVANLSNIATVLVGGTKGIYLPYFEGMVLPDKTTIFHVFQSLFSRALANDLDGTEGMLSRLRRGFKNLAFSEAGMSLSHIYSCIELAIQGSALFTPIIESGVYYGSILQGNGLRIKLGNQNVEAVDINELIVKVQAMDSHKLAVLKLMNLIRAVKNDAGEGIYTVSIDSFKTSRSTLGVLITLDKELFDDFSEVRSAVSDLRFRDKFAPFTLAGLKIFLSYVNTGSESLLEPYGAYLGGSYWEMNTRVAVGLGIFGSDAPSINVGAPKDPTFTLPGPSVTDAMDPNLTEVNKKRSLQYIPVAKVPIRVAASQWENVFTNARFSIPSGRGKKQEFTNTTKMVFSVAKSEDFADVYKVLREVAETRRRNKSLGKRPRGDDDQNQNGPSKKQRAAEDLLMDLY